MKQKTYILQKDLPDSKIGDIYIWNDSQKAYFKDGNVLNSYWLPLSVENNEEWFKLKEEKRIFIDSFLLQKSWPQIYTHMYTFRSTHLFTPNQIELIKEAIQKIVNND